MRTGRGLIRRVGNAAACDEHVDRSAAMLVDSKSGASPPSSNFGQRLLGRAKVHRCASAADDNAFVASAAAVDRASAVSPTRSKRNLVALQGVDPLASPGRGLEERAGYKLQDNSVCDSHEASAATRPRAVAKRKSTPVCRPTRLARVAVQQRLKKRALPLFKEDAVARAAKSAVETQLKALHSVSYDSKGAPILSPTVGLARDPPKWRQGDIKDLQTAVSGFIERLVAELGTGGARNRTVLRISSGDLAAAAAVVFSSKKVAQLELDSTANAGELGKFFSPAAIRNQVQRCSTLSCPQISRKAVASIQHAPLETFLGGLRLRFAQP